MKTWLPHASSCHPLYIKKKKKKDYCKAYNLLEVEIHDPLTNTTNPKRKEKGWIENTSNNQPRPLLDKLNHLSWMAK